MRGSVGVSSRNSIECARVTAANVRLGKHPGQELGRLDSRCEECATSDRESSIVEVKE